MPRGGARAVSGPAPDPNALRRDRPSDKDGWTILPADGRIGDPPAWPLINPTDRELAFWADMWTRPQAVMWEALGQDVEVAFYVRKLVEAEQPRASVELRKSIRQDFDSLGLSVQGMLRNRWKIADAVEPASAETPKTTKRKSAGAKGRLKVVANGDE